MSLPTDLATLVREAARDGQMWVTPIVRMEILYSARTRTEYIALEAELDVLRIVRNDRAVADTAMRALSELAARNDGYHGIPVPDALIAAGAAEHGGVAVLHRDAHFDRSPRRSPARVSPCPAPERP